MDAHDLDAIAMAATARIVYGDGGTEHKIVVLLVAEVRRLEVENTQLRDEGDANLTRYEDALSEVTELQHQIMSIADCLALLVAGREGE